MHWTKLQHKAVRGTENLVVGKTYVICHNMTLLDDDEDAAEPLAYIRTIEAIDGQHVCFEDDLYEPYLSDRGVEPYSHDLEYSETNYMLDIAALLKDGITVQFK